MLKSALWVCVVLVFGGGLWWWFQRPEPVLVRLHEVERGSVEATASNTRAGTVTACRRAKLSPAISGQIVRLPYRKGAQVKQGEVLLELWSEDVRANRELTARELDVAVAKSKAACALAAQAERAAVRQDRLRPGGLVSADIADKARAEADSQHAQCRASKAQVEMTRARFSVLDAQLERTVVRAPFDGIIVELNGEKFEITTPSPPGIPTPPTIDLIEFGCIYVEAPIDEVDAAAVSVGMPVRVSLDAFRGELFAGKVRQISAYVEDREKQARFVTVEIALADDPRKAGLLPGYSADAEIILDRREGVVRIPSEAIMEDGAVLLFDADKQQIVRRSLTKGLANWRWTEVTEGLRGGEQLVLNFDDEGVAAGEPARSAQAGDEVSQ